MQLDHEVVHAVIHRLQATFITQRLEDRISRRSIRPVREHGERHCETDRRDTHVLAGAVDRGEHLECNDVRDQAHLLGGLGFVDARVSLSARPLLHWSRFDRVRICVMTAGRHEAESANETSKTTRAHHS